MEALSSSVFYYDYQVFACTLYDGTLKSFGREPVSRTEQRTEYRVFFLHIYIFFSFSLFSRHLLSDQQQLVSADSATYKREMCALSLSRLLNNLIIFLARTQTTRINTYATRFRSLVEYFSYSSHFFGRR